jgi:amyloid beta precursor protein binding protein 1
MDTPPDHETPSLAVKYSAHPHVRPDAKQQRYDRQLRLWAASGQTALESAHILVVNAGATATSILKNLVLPGIGQFTLLDDKRVMQQDLGNNFFLQPGSSNIGVDYRAEQATKYLSELNGGVKAGCLTEVGVPFQTRTRQTAIST